MPVAVAQVRERQSELAPLTIVPDQPVNDVTPAQLEQARASARMLGVLLLGGLATWLAVGAAVLGRVLG